MLFQSRFAHKHSLPHQMSLTASRPAPFNQILGVVSSDVPAYSNDDDEFFSVERHYLYGIFMGYKWQCVELARRWLLMRKSCVFKSIGCAADIWTDVNCVERVTDSRRFPLKALRNGSLKAPKKNSFLIYPRSSERPFGHVAIITDIMPGFVRIIEQNYNSQQWSSNYARQIPLIINDDSYYINDVDPIFGWMEIEDDSELQPFDESKIDTILRRYQQSHPMGKMERCVILNPDSKHSWLANNDDPAVKFFVELARDDIIGSESAPYYKIDQHLMFNIGSASNDLHRMFLGATHRVINDDELLVRCGIPEIFWPRIRQSWANERDLTMTGRFDLAFDGKQLKVFEYNADCASALFECAVIQEKWAKTVDLPSKFMSAFQLHRVLINNWKNLNIKTCVHLLIDDDDSDELLTGLYMQGVMKQAGIKTKLCVGIRDFQWENSTIVDGDGQTVEIIWKLWMWETIMKDYLQTPINDRPRLSDILLNDRIRVIEPFWKVITSNKGLLPVLWSMFPNHPYLLRSEWTLTDELSQTPFVKKPIVGRCGQNVTLYDTSEESVIDETMGKFSNRNSIYQKLFSLKNNDGYYGIIGSWIVGGLFAGFCIREDQKLITIGDSTIAACCIVWEDTKEDS